MPSPLKSPVAMDMGLSPVAGFCEFVQFSPLMPVPSAAVPKTAFPLLVSKKDTVPVGEANPSLSTEPATVAVSV